MCQRPVATGGVSTAGFSRRSSDRRFLFRCGYLVKLYRFRFKFGFKIHFLMVRFFFGWISFRIEAGKKGSIRTARCRERPPTINRRRNAVGSLHTAPTGRRTRSFPCPRGRRLPPPPLLACPRRHLPGSESRNPKRSRSSGGRGRRRFLNRGITRHRRGRRPGITVRPRGSSSSS